MKLTGIIIAKNEEEMIADAIDSLKFCDEIVVVDNNSEDNTKNLSEKLGASVVSVNTDDFSALRNVGRESAKGDWILYLDADERVTKELGEEILLMIKYAKRDAYRVKRKNFYLGKNEWPKIEKMERLFKKSALKEWEGKLHESPVVDGEIGDLDNHITHFTHRSLTAMLDKTIKWSTTEALTRYDSDHPRVSWWRFPRVMIPAFFDCYFKQKGYKKGTAGMVESIYQAFSVFITYAKLWELQNKKG